MHIGHTRYTSTLLNINNQCAHELLSVLHFINTYNKQMFCDNTVCSRTLWWWFFINGNVFCLNIY